MKSLQILLPRILFFGGIAAAAYYFYKKRTIPYLSYANPRKFIDNPSKNIIDIQTKIVEEKTTSGQEAPPLKDLSFIANNISKVEKNEKVEFKQVFEKEPPEDEFFLLKAKALGISISEKNSNQGFKPLLGFSFKK